MDYDEIRNFEWARKLVKQQRYAQALPILQVLAKRHPEDGEIEKVLADCTKLSGGYISTPSPRERSTYGEAQPLTPDYHPLPNLQGYNMLYLIPLIGSLAVAIGVFLPWLSVGVATGFISVDGSINGIGSFSGSALLGSAFAKNPPISGIDGYFLIGLAVLSLMVSVAGLTNSNLWGWKLGIIFGLIAGGIALYDLISISSKVTTVNQSFSSTNDSSVAAAAQTGSGIYIALVGGVLLIVGFIMSSNKPRLN